MNELFQMPITVEVPATGLPDPDTLTYYHLEKDRKIYLDFEIDESVLSVQKMIIRWNTEDLGKPREERTPIRLYIVSFGGSINYMWAIIDAILLSETPIYTINMGIAASAAGLIFIAGEKRYMLPNAKVLIHEGSAEIGGDAVKVIDQTDAYKKMLQKMKDYILSRTTILKKDLNKKRANDWELDANYCLEHNVCTDIVSSINQII